MRTLTPKRRRAAVVCGACAAIIPSTSIFMHQHPASTATEFIGGLLIGVALAASVSTLLECRTSN